MEVSFDTAARLYMDLRAQKLTARERPVMEALTRYVVSALDGATEQVKARPPKITGFSDAGQEQR